MSSSSAPHITEAAKAAGLTEWGPQPDAIEGQSISSGRLLWKRDEGGERVVEAGLWVCTPGAWRLSLPGDELCYFLGGRATYTEHNGETIEVGPGTVVHFPSGWTGRCDVEATLAQHLYAGPRAHGHRPRRRPDPAGPATGRPPQGLGARADHDRGPVGDRRHPAA